MKFEYTHDFEIDKMLKVQTELCGQLYSQKTRFTSLFAILLGSVVSIFGVALSCGFLARLLGVDKYDGIAIIVGIFLGALLYLKVILPRINGYFFSKQKIFLDKAYNSNYIFQETGIIVEEIGRTTNIDWSVVSNIHETKNYIGLLCRGLFYYLPRETIGDTADQDSFIIQCKLWMEEAKKQ